MGFPHKTSGRRVTSKPYGYEVKSPTRRYKTHSQKLRTSRSTAYRCGRSVPDQACLSREPRLRRRSARTCWKCLAAAKTDVSASAQAGSDLSRTERISCRPRLPAKNATVKPSTPPSNVLQVGLKSGKHGKQRLTLLYFAFSICRCCCWYYLVNTCVRTQAVCQP